MLLLLSQFAQFGARFSAALHVHPQIVVQGLRMFADHPEEHLLEHDPFRTVETHK